jgi:hypothetical protein
VYNVKIFFCTATCVTSQAAHTRLGGKEEIPKDAGNKKIIVGKRLDFTMLREHQRQAFKSCENVGVGTGAARVDTFRNACKFGQIDCTSAETVCDGTVTFFQTQGKLHCLETKDQKDTLDPKVNNGALYGPISLSPLEFPGLPCNVAPPGEEKCAEDNCPAEAANSTQSNKKNLANISLL